jgi:hypothetical protein
MAARCRNQRCYDANKIVVHVPRVAECGSAGRHDGRYQLVGLLEGGIHDVQPVCSDL